MGGGQGRKPGRGEADSKHVEGRVNTSLGGSGGEGTAAPGGSGRAVALSGSSVRNRPRGLHRATAHDAERRTLACGGAGGSGAGRGGKSRVGRPGLAEESRDRGGPPRQALRGEHL